jgi:hypothetical protein
MIRFVELDRRPVEESHRDFERQAPQYPTREGTLDEMDGSC